MEVTGEDERKEVSKYIKKSLCSIQLLNPYTNTAHGLHYKGGKTGRPSPISSAAVKSKLLNKSYVRSCHRNIAETKFPSEHEIIKWSVHLCTKRPHNTTTVHICSM